ncbi:ECF subfamily RNA polymerase sigma-24 subunit [Seminavis robusta]|uniref:ECF subfamily RNA polymerase sigma-24 subunit n=1 Tax=Seminavis robusta TaxID=568900 RepID=A0A9N8DGE9_9STRA|nr:ECF subfamily RNA polymerase sigma-24 subunit [Seminavis robusta]|eukprot:Sro112_g055850.1 ECF subfamily RNA polymerase sigma-24 subunit (662) ;mRNA; r:101331-103316
MAVDPPTVRDLPPSGVDSSDNDGELDIEGTIEVEESQVVRPPGDINSAGNLAPSNRHPPWLPEHMYHFKGTAIGPTDSMVIYPGTMNLPQQSTRGNSQTQETPSTTVTDRTQSTTPTSLYVPSTGQTFVYDNNPGTFLASAQLVQEQPVISAHLLEAPSQFCAQTPSQLSGSGRFLPDTSTTGGKWLCLALALLAVAGGLGVTGILCASGVCGSSNNEVPPANATTGSPSYVDTLPPQVTDVGDENQTAEFMMMAQTGGSTEQFSPAGTSSAPASQALQSTPGDDTQSQTSLLPQVNESTNGTLPPSPPSMSPSERGAGVPPASPSLLTLVPSIQLPEGIASTPQTPSPSLLRRPTLRPNTMVPIGDLAAAAESPTNNMATSIQPTIISATQHPTKLSSKVPPSPPRQTFDPAFILTTLPLPDQTLAPINESSPTPTTGATSSPTMKATVQPNPRPRPTPSATTANQNPAPTNQPTTEKPSNRPTPRPTRLSTNNPTPLPTAVPTSAKPTRAPSPKPTTENPTNAPSRDSTRPPTIKPTSNPKSLPPTRNPTRNPTPEPTRSPTTPPTPIPTRKPTNNPTQEPTRKPTPEPTPSPTRNPTNNPTQEPTRKPTPEPTPSPTRNPTNNPTPKPTLQPTDPAADDDDGEVDSNLGDDDTGDDDS